MISSLILNIYTLSEVIIKRILGGFSTLPTLTDWLNAIILVLVYAVIALPLGFWLNFLKFDPQVSRRIAIKIMTTSLITPAILEELFFRVILLPQVSENSNFKIIVTQSTVSLLLFVIYHPLNAITFFPAGRDTFFNPVFLFLATLLGLICTPSYLQSGSIWIPAIVHWLTVVICLLYLGGMKKLSFINLDLKQ